MSDKFRAKFLKIINEDLDFTKDQDALESSLDDGTDPLDFDVDMEPSGEFDEVGDAINRRNQQEVQTLDSWIDQIDQFLHTLNSDAPDSMQSKLANATPDTILDKVKQSQQTKISRVASDLASLHQGLLGFKAMSGSPSLRGV
jgi:septation ring formation regulator EzrA